MNARPHLIPALVVAAMLLVAAASASVFRVSLPYGYYQLLRWFTCGIAIFIGGKTYLWGKKWATWLCAVIAVLFNPFIPIDLPEEIWRPVDLVTGLLVGLSTLLSQRVDITLIWRRVRLGFLVTVTVTFGLTILGVGAAILFSLNTSGVPNRNTAFVPLSTPGARTESKPTELAPTDIPPFPKTPALPTSSDTTSAVTLTATPTVILTATPRAVFTFSGTGIMNTPPFESKSTPLKLRYTTDWDGSFLVTESSRGVRVINRDVSRGQTYEDYIYYDIRGSQYFSVIFAPSDGHWTLSVEDNPVMPTPAPGTFFTYSGTGTMNTPPFEVKSSPFKLRYMADWDGQFLVTAGGSIVFNGEVSRGQTYEVNVYRVTRSQYFSVNTAPSDGHWTLSVVP